MGTFVYGAHGAPLQITRSAMSINRWVVLGLIAGFIASKIVSKSGQGFFIDIVLSIVGANAGGLIFSVPSASGIAGPNLYSMVVTVIGAIVVLVIHHRVSDRQTYEAG